MHGVDGRIGHLINLPGCGNNNNSHFGYLAHWLPDFMAQTPAAGAAAATAGSHVQNQHQHQHWPRSSLSCCWRCCVAKYVFVAFLANWQTEFAQRRWPIECSRRERGPLAVTQPVDEFPADYAIMFGHTRTRTQGPLLFACLPNPNCMLLTRIPHFSSGAGGESAVARELWRLPCHLKLFQITHFAGTVRSNVSATAEKARKSAKYKKIKQRA